MTDTGTTAVESGVYPEDLVDSFVTTQSVSELDISHLAIGTERTTPTVSDTSPVCEEYRENFDSTEDLGNALEATARVGEGEARGFTTRSGGTSLVRGLISDLEKTDEITRTFEAGIQIRETV